MSFFTVGMRPLPPAHAQSTHHFSSGMDNDTACPEGTQHFPLFQEGGLGESFGRYGNINFVNSKMKAKFVDLLHVIPNLPNGAKIIF